MGELSNPMLSVEAKNKSEQVGKNIKGDVKPGASPIERKRRGDLREKFTKETEASLVEGLESAEVSDGEVN